MPGKTAAILPILAVLLLIGATSAKNDGKKWGATLEGCRISLSTDREQYTVGEQIAVHVILRNDARKQLRFSDTGLPYRVDVFLPRKGLAPLTLWGQQMTANEILGANEIVTVPQGNEYRKELILNRAYDMSVDGKYAVVVHWRLQSDSDPDAWIDLASNPVVIKVNEPSSN